MICCMFGQLPACFWPVDDPHPSFSTPRLHHNFTFWTWSVPKKGWAKWSLEGLQTIYRVDWRINCPNFDLKTFPVSSGHFKSVLNTFLYILQLKMALTPWTMEQDMWFQIKNSLILGYLDTCWSAFTCVRKNLTQIKQSYCEKNNSTISKNSKTECVSEDSEQVRLCYLLQCPHWGLSIWLLDCLFGCGFGFGFYAMPPRWIHLSRIHAGIQKLTTVKWYYAG